MPEPSYIQRAEKAEAEKQAKREARWNAKHDTMSGMTVQQAKKVRELEDSIADRFTEKGYVVDKNGNIVAETVKGSSSKASFRSDSMRNAKDGVLVHNHPHHEFNSDGGDTSGNYYNAKGIAARIGNSLSFQDLHTASKYDMAEVRARTPTYEFSVKRGENGWGGSPEEISRFIQKEYTRLLAEYDKTGKKNGTIDEQRERIGRLNTIINHKAIESAAKKFGWKYTRTKREERSASDAKHAGKTPEQRRAEAQERAKKRSASAFKRALRKSGFSRW